MSNGIVNFYYTQNLPADSVAIAQIQSEDFNPSDLITINNLNILDTGPLSVWKNTTPLSNAADYTAPDLNQTIPISGATLYYIGNQFFEITNVVSLDNTPLYYEHVLPNGVTDATILDSENNILNVEILIQNSVLFHSQPDGYFQVRYVDNSGFIQVEMLEFTPVISQSFYTTAINLYTYTAKVLSVFTSGTYYIRFTQNNGYQVIVPYDAPSNVPWFARVRFGTSPTPPEWATQPFIPYKPYLLGTWTKGSVLNNSTIQFQRSKIYSNSSHLPDILIFDSNNQFKYALDGTAVGTVSTKGYLYNWKQGLINEVDNNRARVSVAVDLDPTDLVFGFYSYQEDDYLFTDLDLNPFTNPLVRNSQVTFYLKTNGINVNKYIYYILEDINGNTIQTNDFSPDTGTNQIFSQLVVGASVSVSSLNVTDIRQRGGGLVPALQDIPQAANFWDLGFWNGKSYPVAGALLIYLPQTLLNSLSESEITSKIQSILPLGIIPVVKYYNSEGDEY
jgi:hypothetical protein